MIPFTKLEGNGNDFILIDEYHGELVPEREKPGFAARFCHRRFGIGADGVLYLQPSDKADLKMRLLQPDCSEAEMCGNGIRCLARYALEAGYITEGEARVETPAGILTLKVTPESVRVDMGTPLYQRGQIPAQGDPGDTFLEVELHSLPVSAVNTGVPHAVIITNNLENIKIEKIAPEIRFHPIFPQGANVNFVKIKSRDEIEIRTYERGVEAETLSCGTGSVAAAAIATRLGKTRGEVKVNTKGGPLKITLKEDKAYMEGPANIVFKGNLPIKN